MSKALSQLLGKTEIEVRNIINRLEELAGYPAEDIRALADIKVKTARQISSLGLDPSDTTAAELRRALELRAERDDRLFSKAVGWHTAAGSDKLAKLLAGLAGSASPDVWCLKKTVIRDLLRRNPPKKLMKSLGYRSVESMLKREAISELYAALPFTESQRWLSSFWKKHAEFSPADFETRPMEFMVMPAARWSETAGRAGTVTCLLPIGAVAVWPLAEEMPHKCLSLAVMLLEAAETTAIYSTCLQIEQVNPSFGAKILEFLKPQLSSPLSIGEAAIGWDVLHRHYGRQGSDKIPSFFNPDLGVQELQRKSVSEQLSRFHPLFNWWTVNDSSAASMNGETVSLNIVDVINGNYAKTPHTSVFQRCLWNELLLRYLKFPGVGRHLLSQLDNNEAAGETRSISITNSRKIPQAMIQAEFA